MNPFNILLTMLEPLAGLPGAQRAFRYPFEAAWFGSLEWIFFGFVLPVLVLFGLVWLFRDRL